jgi:type VI secretion system protein
MDSVRDNLARLLNSRQGMSEALPDYGLPAMADLTFGGGDDARRVEEAIRMAVEKYEPRLRRIRVSPVVHEDAGQHRHSLSFRIDATLRGASGEHRVWYETEVRGTGEFDVLS